MHHTTWPRVRDCFLYGKDNYHADRVAADMMREAYPDLPACVRTTVDFLRQEVRLIAQDGITQYVDLAGGYPTMGADVHEIVQRYHPDAQVVYVEPDPLAYTHGLALRQGDGLAHIQTDPGDIDAVLTEVRGVFDLEKPTAFLLAGILERVPDAAAVIDAITAAAAPGSPIVMTHLFWDQDGVMDRLTHTAAVAGIVLYPRAVQEIAVLLDGIALLGTGLARVDQHLPELSGASRQPGSLHCVAAVGMVPHRPGKLVDQASNGAAAR